MSEDALGISTQSPEDPAAAAAGANELARQGLLGTLGPKLEVEFLELGRERVVARIPVETNTQPYGALHGGATAALVETIGSIGTAVVAGGDRAVSGIELNVNHIRAVREGVVTAVGVPLHVGRTTAVWDVRVHDDEDRLVAVGRLTVAIRDPA